MKFPGRTSVYGCPRAGRDGKRETEDFDLTAYVLTWICSREELCVNQLVSCLVHCKHRINVNYWRFWTRVSGNVTDVVMALDGPHNHGIMDEGVIVELNHVAEDCLKPVAISSL